MSAGLVTRRTEISKTPGGQPSIEALTKRIEKLENNQTLMRVGLKEILVELSINKEQTHAILYMLIEEGFLEQMDKAN